MLQPRHEKVTPTDKVEAALRLIQSMKRAPTYRDSTELPGGGKRGWFWTECKKWRRCEVLPYDRLLSNPVLKADYR